MSREAERWNIDLGVENRGFRKATRAGQPKEGSRMRLPEEVSKKREVTSSPVPSPKAHVSPTITADPHQVMALLLGLPTKQNHLLDAEIEPVAAAI